MADLFYASATFAIPLMTTKTAMPKQECDAYAKQVSDVEIFEALLNESRGGDDIFGEGDMLFPNQTTAVEFAQNEACFTIGDNHDGTFSLFVIVGVVIRESKGRKDQITYILPKRVCTHCNLLEATIPMKSGKDIDFKTKHGLSLQYGSLLYHKLYGAGLVTFSQPATGKVKIQFANTSVMFTYPQDFSSGMFYGE